MEETERIAFRIISAVGSAKSAYIEAITAAKRGDFDMAVRRIEEGDESFLEGHKAHGELLTTEAGGGGAALTLLLAHAEDQLMGAEGFKTVALEFIEAYRRIEALEAENRRRS